MAELSDAFAAASTPNLTMLGRIVSLCERYESEWRSGREPAIEPLLDTLDGPDRIAALRELVTVEVGLRRSRGESPSREDYLVRFPEHPQVITQVFETRAPEKGDPYQTVVESNATIVAEPPAWPPPPDPDAPVVGHYRIVRSHAKGGLGEVFVAYDEVLKREVALKQMQSHRADDPRSRSRFLTEAEVTGSLEHPGIVPVYGLGRDDADRPYYAMRFIRGDTFELAIRRYHESDAPKSQRRLEIRQLLLRFLAVCNAVAYANSRGVLHRDLKPGNVMLGPFGETLVVDWGLAKVTNGSEATDRWADAANDYSPSGEFYSALRNADTATQAGTVLGTPQFMSPEQAAGHLEEMGPWSDVYSLGAMLYNLLTGRPPVESADLYVMLRKVKEGDIAAPRQVNPNIPPNLEAICLKALARERADRYQSARELADDLESWLADAPVTAAKDPILTACARWARRHKPLVAALTGIILSALAVTLLAVRALERQRIQDAAEAQREIDRVNSERERQAMVAANAERVARSQEYNARLGTIRESRINPQPGWTWNNIEALAGLSRLDSDVRDELALRSEAGASLTGSDLRPVAEYARHFTAASLAYRPDGKVLAVGQFKAQLFVSCSVRLVNLTTGNVFAELSVPPRIVRREGANVQDGVRGLTFSRDGKWLVAGLRSGRLVRWDLSKQDHSATHWDAHTSEIARLIFDGDGHALLSLDHENNLRRWDLRAGWKEAGVARVRDLAAGDHTGEGSVPFYCIQEDGRVAKLDPTTLKPAAPMPIDQANLLAVCPNGRFVVAVRKSQLELISTTEGVPIRRLFDPVIDQAHGGPIHSVHFSADGSRLLTSCDQNNRREIKVWEVAGGRLLATIDPGGVTTLKVALRPDGRGFAATSERSVVAYEFSRDDVLRTVAFEHEPLRAVEFDPDGNVLAALSRGQLGIWDPRTGANLLRKPTNIGPDSDAIVGIAHDPTGPLLAYHGTGDDVHIWNPEDPKPPLVLKVPTPGRLVFAHDGKRLWGISRDQVFSWTKGESEPRFHWKNIASDLLTGLSGLVAMAVGERDILVAARDGVVHQLSAVDGSHVKALLSAADPVRSLTLSPDGQLAVAGTQNGDLWLIPLPAGEPRRIRRAHGSPVLSMTFGPLGLIMVSGSYDGCLRFWSRDGSEFQPAMMLRPSPRPIDVLSWSGDGARMAILIRGENAIRVLDLHRLHDRLDEVGIPLGHLRKRRPAEEAETQ